MNDQTRSLLIWVVIGLIAGWLASLIVGSGTGLLGYIIAGLIGSVVGGFLAQQLKIKLNLGNAFLEQLIVSVIGAIIVLIIARIIT
ncbi:MAG: GlsB/YeaQ/YmgE family stress response membrane protein [Bauldia sp.]